MNISIIIPAYNESAKITKDIVAADEFIVSNNFQGEIIVVDDGSEDGTSDIAKTVNVSKNNSLQVIGFEKNRGKGFAVRTGILNSTGEFVLSADSGLCIPFDFALRGMQIIKSGSCDIAHGSRRLPDSVIVRRKPLFRRYIPYVFRWIFIHWLNIPAEFTDTQCGFKIYDGTVARELYEQCVTNGFLFEVEIILRALRKKYRIKEFPVEWTSDPDSRLSLKKHAMSIIRELFALKRLLSEL
ncbi:glycosyltransferase [candidate division KSB1 bacterium]